MNADVELKRYPDKIRRRSKLQANGNYAFPDWSFVVVLRVRRD